jgi:potassium-dependent mechanosensitive channel
MKLAAIDNLLRRTLFTVGDQSVTLLRVLQLILTLLIVFVLSHVFKRLLKERLLIGFGISQGNREVISTLLSYGSGTLGFIVVLEAYGFNLTSLALLLGGLGVGMGFGLQDITKNLVSGLTLLVENKLQVGDFVEFEGLSGYIKEISMRSTIVRTFDGGDVVIPNSNLISGQVLNWSYKNFTGKLRLSIGVSYDSDPILVTETLLNSAYFEPLVLHDPPPKVIFKGFGENALEFELWVWVSRIDEGISVRSSLNFIIEHHFRQAGLKMAFPQRDMWLRNPEALSSQQDSLTNTQPNGDLTTLNGERSQGISIRECLQQVPYFQNLSVLRLREVIESGYRKVLHKSQVLFREGESGDTAYIVLSGLLESVSIKLERVIKTYHAADLLGEVPIMLEIPYTVTVRALEETHLFVIPKRNFEKLLQSHSDFAALLAEEMTKEKEIYVPLSQELKDLGLIDDSEQHQSLVMWIRTRLQNLFNPG